MLEETSLEGPMSRKIQLMAKMPTIIAAFARLRSGQTPVEPYLGFVLISSICLAPMLIMNQCINLAARVCAPQLLTDIYPA